MKRLSHIFELNPLTITIVYIVLGLLLTLFSDQLLLFFVNDLETFSKLESLTGVFFVLITAVLIYFLTEFGSRQLLATTEKVDKALQSVKIATWSVNLKTNESITSRYHYKLFGLDKPPKNWTIADFYQAVHPKDRERVEKTFLHAIKTQTPYQTTYRVVWPDESIRWMRSHGTVQENEEGELVQIAGVIADITKEIEMEEEIARDKELFERIFEQIPVMIDIYNPEINKLKVNKAFEKTIGWTNAEIRDIDIMKACYPDPEMRERAQKVMNEADGNWYSFEVTDKEGNKRTQRWSNIRLSDETTIGIGLDITERSRFETTLKERNEFIEAILENLPIGVSVNLIDSGKVTLMNKRFSDIFGWPQEVLTDVETFFQKVYPDEAYRKKMKEIVMADLGSGNPERMNWRGARVTTQAGEKRIVNIKNIPLYDQNLMISTVVDVTARVKAEKKLAESENKYRHLFQQSPLPMWIYDPDTLKFVEVNEAAVQHYGYSREEFSNMTLLDIRPEEDYGKVKEAIRGIGNNLSLDEEWRHIKKSGELIHVQVSGSSIEYLNHDYRLILVKDITQQKKADEMILASLVEGENKERARVARELHDGLGQYLAAANMNLDAVRDEISAIDIKQNKKEQFEKGLTLLKHAITETGRISRNLLPRVVDDYGLVIAIEALINSYNNDNGTNINYYQNMDGLNLPREIEFNLYRIAQEALSNAVKYAEAGEINIQLIKDKLDLILTIEDNGVGFDISSAKFSQGLGLQTIKTRTGAMTGDLEIESKPVKGTLISVVVPVEKYI